MSETSSGQITLHQRSISKNNLLKEIELDFRIDIDYWRLRLNCDRSLIVLYEHDKILSDQNRTENEPSVL